MKRIVILLLMAALILNLGGCGAKSAESQFIAMDTVMTFRAEGKEAEEALAAAKTRIYEMEELLSRTRAGSEVTALNQAGGASVEVSPVLRMVLEAALEYRELTDGTFDVTIAPVADAWGFTTETRRVPSKEVLEAAVALVDSGKIILEGDSVTLGAGQQIDLGGIAKGYVSDLMEAFYAEYKVQRGTVDLGGNIYVRGTKEDGSPWMVGIRDPENPDTNDLVGTVSLSDAFFVTSGGYQRYFEQDGIIYHHIIDPATGYPADGGLTSVTVVAPASGRTGMDEQPGNGTMCDALSTALFVMGEEAALEFWRSSDLDFDLILVTEDARVLVTDGIAEQFTPTQKEVYTYETVS